MPNTDFSVLSPETIIDAAEKALNIEFTGLTYPLPSYINRVYELESIDKERFIIKFYRPGRWNKKTIQDEHIFINECADAEIPVIAPLKLANNETLYSYNGFNLAIFPKKYGRAIEINDISDYKRIGMLIGRAHTVGAQKIAKNRITLHPENSLRKNIDFLYNADVIDLQIKHEFKNICEKIYSSVCRVFDSCSNIQNIRLHGDAHQGNMLSRYEEGLFLIDFDDMMMGPAVYDMWRMLPEHMPNAMPEFNILLEGYTQFMDFDQQTIKLIEPMRAMHMLYFLNWCAHQIDDYHFEKHFPDWGSYRFWQNELSYLSKQLRIIDSI